MLNSYIIWLHCCPVAQHKHNHHHLTPSLEKDSLVHQVYTRDWESSTTDNQTAPQTTSRNAFMKMIIVGFTLERWKKELMILHTALAYKYGVKDLHNSLIIKYKWTDDNWKLNNLLNSLMESINQILIIYFNPYHILFEYLIIQNNTNFEHS